MSYESGTRNRLVISYLTLRKAIGYLGAALPFVLSIGGMLIYSLAIQGSLSSYYHTGMRDVFVGTLCAIGVFLFAYKGYEQQDNLAGNLAGICAVGTALFPTTPDTPSALEETIGTVHIVFAAGFFMTLAYFSLVLFTKTDPTIPPTSRKIQRNRIYRICGYVIVVAIILIALISFLPSEASSQFKRLDSGFWLESAAILAFGVSWLTKGEAILKDQPRRHIAAGN